MSFDWSALTDEEVETEVSLGTAEMERRKTLADAQKQVDDINRAVLEAEGIKPGDPWRQPTGTHDAYPQGSVVTHNGSEWDSLVSGNVWEPGVSGWRQIGDPGEPQPWVQPTGAHDAYQKDDTVTHIGEVWQSQVYDNVWEPGVYGWLIVTPV